MADAAGQRAAQGPFAGLRVVEFAGIGPGPFAAMLLADMGAVVARIARPDAAPPGPGDVLLRNRTTVPVDLKSPGGRKRALGLIAKGMSPSRAFAPV